MFTGIIGEIGRISSAQSDQIIITAREVLHGMELGGSINVNGVCLTVNSFSANSFTAGLMAETLKRTNLGLLSAGDRVNLECPLAVGGRLGGHLVQGHVDATGRLISNRWDGVAKLIRCGAPSQVMNYVVEKGFIAVDGISLTVTERDARSFEVSIIEYTRKHTNLDDRQVGDVVNLEVDIIAKYVEHLNQARTTGVTVDFLAEHGFLVG